MRTDGRHRPTCRCPDCRTESRSAASGRLGWDWTLLRYKASTTLLLGVVVLLLVGVAAAAGAAIGYKLGMDDGYGWQATANIGFHVTPTSDQFPTYVYWTGNQTIDGYTFVLGTDQHPQLAGSTTGYAPPGGPIYIESNRRLVNVYETCVHEKLHRTHPSAPHRWIYDVEGRVVDETCLKLVHAIG